MTDERSQCRLRVHNLVVSLDGYATGDDQRREAPFGDAQERIIPWFRAARVMRGFLDEAPLGVDEAIASQWADRIGAEIMGRNKFGPQRGPWLDDGWKGWWGDDPPFHTPCFILTHFPRPPIVMQGGTTFHFVDAHPAEALAMAREAADGLDVRLGGGPSTIREFLAADLIDHLHVIVVPIVLGRGVGMWDGLRGLEERFEVESVTAPSGATHVTFTRLRR
jgi:dihydrofolate reductase